MRVVSLPGIARPASAGSKGVSANYVSLMAPFFKIVFPQKGEYDILRKCLQIIAIRLRQFLLYFRVFPKQAAAVIFRQFLREAQILGKAQILRTESKK
jgi:hypothetical protein